MFESPKSKAKILDLVFGIRFWKNALFLFNNNFSVKS